MKKKKNFGKIEAIIIITLMIIGTAATITLKVEADVPVEIPNEINLNYTFTQPIITEVIVNETLYHKVTMENLPTVGDIDTPLLPVKSVNLLLPQLSELESINVTYQGNVSLGYGFNVELGQRPFIPDYYPQNWSNESTAFDPTKPYPTELFLNAGINYFRGYNILTFNLYPVHYVGETGELYYYEEMYVTLNLLDNISVNPYFRGLPEDEQMMYQKVDDCSMSYTYLSPPDNPLPQSSPVDSNDTYQYVIITNEELKNSQFQELINYKISRGTPATIVTVEDIVTCPEYRYSGVYGDNYIVFDDTQCRIRNFIKDAYLNWGTEYVLLGGDTDIIPHRGLYVIVQGLEDNDIPADMYYGCLDGSFNRDRDLYWGEVIGDKVDLRAEVYVGRACVGNSEEVSNFVSKTLGYSNINDEYLENALMAGEHLADDYWGGDTMEQLVDGYTSYGYTTVGIPSGEYNITKLYDKDWEENGWPEPWFGSGGWNKSEITDIINSGVHFINHLGHGNNFRVMKLDEPVICRGGEILGECHDIIDNLTNDKYFFLYSQACYSGAFDNRSVNIGDPTFYYPYDCIAEYLTVKTEHGAFAVITNSRLGLAAARPPLDIVMESPSQRFHRQFIDAIFGEGQENPRMRELGVANQDSKEDNIFISKFPMYRWCCYQLNLLGDPQISLKPAVLPEHDIAVSFTNMPKYVLPGETFLVEAWILNKGTSDENNVLVKLKIDDDVDNSTIIDTLLSNSAVYVNFTCSVPYGQYEFTVEAQPVPEEECTEDNSRSETIISNNPPNTPLKPWGDESCTIFELCTYYTNTTDPNGNSVRYKWIWRGGNFRLPGPWSLLRPSGETVSRVHMWVFSGTARVNVKAMDSLGWLSGESPTLEITVKTSFSCF